MALYAVMCLQSADILGASLHSLLILIITYSLLFCHLYVFSRNNAVGSFRQSIGVNICRLFKNICKVTVSFESLFIRMDTFSIHPALTGTHTRLLEFLFSDICKICYTYTAQNLQYFIDRRTPKSYYELAPAYAFRNSEQIIILNEGRTSYTLDSTCV